MFLRVWQNLNLEDVRKSLFIIGELSGECFSCHNLGISLKEKRCPSCKQEFKYIAFRRKLDMHTINKFKAEFPKATFIDFEDFKRATSKKEARKILDI